VGAWDAEGREAAPAQTEAELRRQLQEARDQAEKLRAEKLHLTRQLAVANELLARMQHLTQALQSIRRRSSNASNA
jgi:hypothetical protein